MVFKNTTEGIINFREAVRNWAYECAKHSEGPLTDETLARYRDDYLADMEIEVEDYEDAECHFDAAFRQAWEEESAR